MSILCWKLFHYPGYIAEKNISGSSNSFIHACLYESGKRAREIGPLSFAFLSPSVQGYLLAIFLYILFLAESFNTTSFL